MHIARNRRSDFAAWIHAVFLLRPGSFMESWLTCRVGLGQFSSEFSVEAERHDGSRFSLFAPIEDVEVERTPNADESLPGLLQVNVMRKDSDRVLVRLPREAFEAGYYVTVRPSDLQMRPARQEA